VLVPTRCLYEVFKRVAQQRGEVAAHTVTAILWTQDAHFQGLPQVEYRAMGGKAG